MPKTWEPGICNETSGFLFSHPCDQLCVHQCGKCGRPICEDHAQHDVGRILCTTCARKRAGRGHDTYDDYDPYFYGGTGYGHSRGGFFFHRHDPHDFTEGDAAGLRAEMDDDFENDMSAS